MQNLPVSPENSLRVIACPHPFKTANEVHSFDPSISVAQILREIQPDEFLRRRAHVWVNDKFVSALDYETTFPKPGSHIDIRVVPSGGVGRMIGMIFLAIAAMVFIWAAPAIFAALGATLGGALLGVAGGLTALGSVVAGLGAMAIGIVGNLALNALCPPVQPRLGGGGGSADSPTFALQGASNVANLYGPIPKTLGRYRVSPSYGARTYTETAGKDQYLHLCFVWGFGPIQIEDLRIGQTPIGNFPDIQITHKHLLYITPAGVPDLPFTPVNPSPGGFWEWLEEVFGITNTSGGGVILPNPTETFPTVDEGAYPITIKELALAIRTEQNVPNQRSSSEGADELAVDVSCPGGLSGYDNDGNPYAINCIHTVYYKSPEEAFGAFRYVDAITMTGATKSAVRGTLKWTPVTTAINIAKQYDIMVIRTSPVDGRQTMSISYWDVLRTITHEEPVKNLPLWLNPNTGQFEPRRLAVTIMRIKATGQLSGTVNEFSGVVTTICPDWDKGALTSVEINAGGSKYMVGDLIPVIQGLIATDGLIKVSTIGSGGAVTGFTIWHGGSNYMYAMDVTTSPTRGGGTGFKINILEVSAGEWVPRTTQNPASLYREAVQGSQCAKPLPNNRLDLDRLQYWHEYCSKNTTYNAETDLEVSHPWQYNKHVDYQTAAKDILGEIASAGRAAFAWVDSKLGVIIDEPQTFYKGPAFTPRNIVKNSFSATIAYPDMPHAFRVPFRNEEKDYLLDERLVLDDGYLIEGKDAWGVDHAVGDAFYGVNDLEGPNAQTNLLIDPNCELPLDLGSGWGLRWWPDTVLTFQSTEKVKEGTYSIKVEIPLEREHPQAGIFQASTEEATVGKTYKFEAWVYWLSGVAPRPYVTYYVEGGIDQEWPMTVFGNPHSAIGTWQKLTAIYNHTEANNENPFICPMVGINETDGGSVFYIDQAKFVELDPSLPVYKEATVFEQIEFPGVTNNYLIFKHARYHIASARLRPETSQFSTDFEWLVATRGDRFKFAHDVMLVGLAWGRVKDLVLEDIIGYSDDVPPEPIYSGLISGVIVDEFIPMQAGYDYVMRFRCTHPSWPNDSLLCPLVNDLETIKYGSGVKYGEGGVYGHDGLLEPRSGYEVRFVTPIDGADMHPIVGDLFLFGESELEAIDLIIKSIQPNSDLSAIVTAVSYNEAIYEADQGPIPEFDSQMSLPLDWWLPIVDDVRSDGSALLMSADGSWISRILVTLWIPSLLSPLITGVEARYWLYGFPIMGVILPVVDIQSGEVSILPVEDGRIYEFQLRYVRMDGSRGTWTTPVQHTVEGKTAPPEDVTRFTVSQLGGIVTFEWDPVVDLDIAGYEIRYGETAISWAESTLINQVFMGTTFSTSVVPSGQWDFLIKAKDTSGNYSVNAKRESLEIYAFATTLSDIPQHPSWPGTLENFVRNPLTGNLNPDDKYLANDAVYEADFELFDSYVADPYDESSYIAPEIDLGSDKTVRIYARITTNIGPGDPAPGVDNHELQVDYVLEADYIDPGYDGFEPWIIEPGIEARYVLAKVIVDNAIGVCRLTNFQPIVDQPV